jgi:hypothetical protein
MARGLFIITELRPSGEGERFEWTADRDPPSAKRGGGRAAPKGGWTLGLSQHNVRTDYPGARRPTHQILGARCKPFTWSGKWDDRYNFPGYAVAEMKRFREMVERGNTIRFQYRRQVLEGIIGEFDPTYVHEALVRYEFTVSVETGSTLTSRDRSPPGPLTPPQRFDQLDLLVAAMQTAHDTAPSGAIAGTVVSDVADIVVDATAARNDLGNTLDLRDIAPGEKPSDTLPKLATQFRVVGQHARGVIDELAAVRSDVDLAFTGVEAVLRFEDWSRSLRWYARTLLHVAIKGGDDMDERAAPDAKQLYRPHEGESLYQIARKTLGAAEAWRLIADRNNLSHFVMRGDELLIIPARGQG